MKGATKDQGAGGFFRRVFASAADRQPEPDARPLPIAKTTLNLADIQGFILRGYRMPMVRHFLLTVGVPAKARELLGRLVSGDESLREAREALGLALGVPEETGVAPDVNMDGLARDTMQSCQVITDVNERPDIAAALHECFEAIDVRPLLPGIKTPVLLLSGDKSRIASEQQKILAERLPHGRLELFAGYGHGVNLLQPERCARTALEFWRTAEEVQR